MTVTRTLSDEPTASPPTTTTTQPPQTTAIPPGGADAFGVADPSRFQLNPPTPVASYAFSVPSHINCLRRVGVHLRDPRRSDPILLIRGAGSTTATPDPGTHRRVVQLRQSPLPTILQGQWREPGAVLEYNEAVRFSVPGAEFACYSTLEALYCTGPQNYGFKLSRAPSSPATNCPDREGTIQSGSLGAI